MQVSGLEGHEPVNSFFQGDATTGTLTPPPRKIDRRYLKFLIGGGMHPDRTCINLVVDGPLIHTATGPNDQPGGHRATGVFEVPHFCQGDCPTGPVRLLKKGTGTTTDSGLTCGQVRAVAGASPLFQQPSRAGGIRFGNCSEPRQPPPLPASPLDRRLRIPLDGRDLAGSRRASAGPWPGRANR